MELGADVAGRQQEKDMNGPSAAVSAAPSSSEVLKVSSAADVDPNALQALVASLQEALRAREAQIERQAIEIAEVRAATEAVTKKNEELVMAKAKVSEQDLEEMQR